MTEMTDDTGNTSNTGNTGKNEITCKYCDKSCDSYNNPSLKCSGECSRQIHVKCLKRGGVPGSLIGDVFFSLYCMECSPLGEETITREKMSWLNIIILTLYNLREKSSGISKRGYFHWKSDISTFVDRNWDYLFQKSVKRKKNWIGTISGTLSHYSTTFFKSGTSELGESGWWRLVDIDPPEVLIAKNSKMIVERKRQPGSIQVKAIIACSPPRSESSLSIGDDSCTGESSRIQTPSMFSREYVQPSEVLSHYLMADDEMPDMGCLDVEDSVDLSDQSLSYTDLMKEYQSQSTLLSGFNPEWMNNILNQSTNHSQVTEIKQEETENENGIPGEDSNESGEAVGEPPNSLFTVNNTRQRPWKRKDKPLVKKKQEKMSNYEVCYLLQGVNKKRLESAPPSIRRFYRKLALRKIKYDCNLPVLDIDSFTLKSDKENMKMMMRRRNRVIDRFYNDNFSVNFEQRLQGHAEPTAIHSPYTNRLLKPFIRRDRDSHPLWLRVLDEMQAKVQLNSDDVEIAERGTIDYCYVRPQHIPAMNSLCSLFFWPGIDLTECLQYPDFTCVVLYKKLIIGLAILVPDVGYNEAYISFLFTRPEWRRCGIGTFMLYHLIQTCMGKDVTLHVSVTNPAIILYQKFGFKIEEFVQDFYDKYMAPGPRESRHALFLRLSR
ncbi:cysteine-rich protein 2-binding protein [Fopius arisanus]|uniref:CSRP2BP_0 protein n=1 Tax=Fopius arisanus TaxID=64838 RepID=A0A0C9PR60_9HYME|nr:PREDICTED: cysteine-rich protein 2-binding protein [Fopius arisanus]